MKKFEKIAVLLGELGVDASDPILAKLNLSTDELSQIRKSMRALGSSYNPNDERQVAKENAVLEEFKRFGEMRGIYKDVPHTAFIKVGETATQNNVRNLAAQDPEALAKVLGMWLKNDE